MSIDLATLAPRNEQPSKASPRFPVEEGPATDLDANGQNTQTVPNEYAVEKIVSQEDSEDDRWC